MSPLGRFLPVKSLSPDRQLLSVKRAIDKNSRQPKSDRQLLRMKQAVKRREKRRRDRRQSARSGHGKLGRSVVANANDQAHLPP